MRRAASSGGMAVVSTPSCWNLVFTSGTATIFANSRLSLATIAGHQYRIEFTDGIGNVWRTLAEISGDGALTTYTDTPALQRQRFYRVLLLR